MHTPVVERIRKVEGPDFLVRPGDFYLKQLRVYNADKPAAEHFAIILNCPFCGRSMASTGMHEIAQPGFFRRILQPSTGITISPHLICPFSPLHKFLIRNGRVIAVQ